jgi:hypothetical protein
MGSFDLKSQDWLCSVSNSGGQKKLRDCKNPAAGLPLLRLNFFHFCGLLVGARG